MWERNLLLCWGLLGRDLLPLAAFARTSPSRHEMSQSLEQSIGRSAGRGPLGGLIAKVLTGAWRKGHPDVHDISEAELCSVIPLLYQNGDAALAWWRIRHSALAESPAGKQLHDAYRHMRLAARIHEQEIQRVLCLLRAEGIEPVLVKGWAIARLYPDCALRPFGDIDLCVPPEQFRKAQGILERLGEHENHFVDLHKGFTNLTRESWDELFERSQLVGLGEEKIRVLSDEDHLRVLCLRLLRNGAWRPLRLCDVAIALEARAASFDWDRCLGTDRRQADWIACSIGLAHHLLGIDIEDTPVADRAKRLPRWLVPAVLRQWNRCRNPHAAGPVLPTLLASITQPKRIFSELYVRWDNPVSATAGLRGRFNNWPRLPYQLGILLLCSPAYAKQLASMWCEFVTPKPLGKSIPGNVLVSDV